LIRPLLLGLLLAHGPSAPSGPEADASALELFERTKTTRATYSLYTWAWIEEPDGGFRAEWGAEFHSGSLRRSRLQPPALLRIATHRQAPGSTSPAESGSAVATSPSSPAA
jgi:hypothetical protein